MYRYCVKRIFDILFSLIAFIFLVPLTILFAPIIFFTDKGPVFYKAERIGQGGKIFKMYKFRSMYVNAPDIRLADGSTYNSEDDPRVTPIGRFLRKTSLDEIPQMFNVFLGQMSLIGPRPDPPDWLDKYPPEIRVFLSVKPGITGYNQAYFRNGSDGTEKMYNDAYYAENISFLLDLKIFFKTIASVLKKENTYKDIGEETTANIKATQMRYKAKEYGSEYNAESGVPYVGANKDYFQLHNAHLYRSGRDALRALAVSLRDRYDTVLFPALCCQSMVSPFSDNGYEIAFYSLNEDYTPNEESVRNLLKDSAVFCFMSYFGSDPNKDGKIDALKSEFPASFFLEDRTQIALSSPSTLKNADAIVLSIRKWLAIPDGGILYTNTALCENEDDDTFAKIREEALKEKDAYLKSGSAEIKQSFREKFNKANDLLDFSNKPVSMSTASQKVLSEVDFALMYRDRTRNNEKLWELLAPIAQNGKIRFLPYSTSSSTLYFPILTDNRDEVQKALAQKGIYCPVIWPLPKGAEQICPLASYTARHILCLPCDHRYTSDDMEFIAKEVAAVVYEEENYDTGRQRLAVAGDHTSP